jgi:regulatory protein
MVQKKLTFSDAKSRIYKFCVYQERCHHEVKEKLYGFGLAAGDVNDLITDLITDGFLNEERFAKAFVGGKFRVKGWGKIKIVRELELRDLTANCIRSGLKEIGEEEYEKMLVQILEKKAAGLTEENDFVRKDKLSRYAIQKGYEPDLVWSILKAKF